MLGRWKPSPRGAFDMLFVGKYSELHSWWWMLQDPRPGSSIVAFGPTHGAVTFETGCETLDAHTPARYGQHETVYDCCDCPCHWEE